MEPRLTEQLISEIGNMSVLELMRLVKQLEETFGVSAAMPVASGAVAAGAGVAAASEEKSEYKVTLKKIDATKKIDAIKAIRKLRPELSLSDAKKAVEEVPTVLAEAAPKADAAAMKKELEAVGAEVELA